MDGENTTSGVRSFRFVVAAEDAGKRLDQILAERVPETSRRRARRMIEAGSVAVDGRRHLVLSRRLHAGQEVLCQLLETEPSPRAALDGSRLLHDDASLVAIDKPAGVPSHPTLARRAGTALQLAESLLERRKSRKVRLWPVHRLDAPTSGVLLFAKSADAARRLSRSFADRLVRKRYWAVVEGIPEPPSGEIDSPIVERHLVSETAPSGKEAHTRYRLVHTSAGRSLLEVEPLTGRMHQIRVHLASIGHAVVGDSRYGSAKPGARLELHAARLELTHPADGRPFVVEAAAPPDFSIAVGASSTARDATPPPT